MEDKIASLTGIPASHGEVRDMRCLPRKLVPHGRDQPLHHGDWHAFFGQRDLLSMGSMPDVQLTGSLPVPTSR